MPTTYRAVGDELPITTKYCTSASPCLSGGVIAITVMNPQTYATDVYYVGSKKFTKEQLDAIDDPENAKLPCPFAAFAIDGGKQMLKSALAAGNMWKFKFNYVKGTNVTINNGATSLGDFQGPNASAPWKWIIGKAMSRESSFHEDYEHANNEMEIEDTYDVINNPDSAVLALFGSGHVDYNEVYCSCLEIYF